MNPDPARSGTDPASSDTDPALDLVLERDVEVPPELVWRAWTEPDLLKRWFTPAPWTTVDCEIDLRPGGMFRTVMRSLLEPRGGGTKYTAIAMHRDVASRQKHEEMGFHAGWGAALDQLVGVAKEL